MGRLYLANPTIDRADDIMAFRDELLHDHGSDHFAGCGTLADCDTTEKWLQVLAQYLKGAEGKVPSTTYLAVRAEDERIVGVSELRHHIEHPILSVWGGHIGYSVRPSERRHGYAKEMLRLVLQRCRERGMERVLITCNHTNIASEKTILANGGVLEYEVSVEGEGIMKRYWIQL